MITGIAFQDWLAVSGDKVAGMQTSMFTRCEQLGRKRAQAVKHNTPRLVMGASHGSITLHVLRFEAAIADEIVLIPLSSLHYSRQLE
jgi:hypothetical protein